MDRPAARGSCPLFSTELASGRPLSTWISKGDLTREAVDGALAGVATGGHGAAWLTNSSQGVMEGQCCVLARSSDDLAHDVLAIAAKAASRPGLLYVRIPG